ncbi:MAG: hypothetical protein U1D25_00040 [Hydrogenophaga sp.]|uniref:hypothetical protein n=1 Tax=Hydrogenophaga sp. TaxID=1904254 RepID=UPI00274F47AF|nr:hypothetical protein [Hydrogenophaga sp.]MDP2416849.1 hypothetical protein [Hydrogenophaga sp.]MDZ4186488.1 hypothetical protein [Hydrogenophaga sp.]
MNPQHTPPTPAAAPAPRTHTALPATAVPTASERLSRSRAKLAGWLDHDRAERAAAPGAGWEALAAWPAVNRWRTHPLAALAVGALARAWQRPATGGAAPPLQAWVLGTATAALRRHPKTVLATVALAVALVVGARWRQRAQPAAGRP